MHQEDQSFIVETQHRGQELLGFAYAGLRSLTVHIVRPFEGFSDNVHLPYFAMGVHPHGFTGSYGRTRAAELLVGLYEKHNDCTCTRRAALPGAADGRAFSEFGIVRLLKTNPGHSEGQGTEVSDTDLDKDIFVRRERVQARVLMRFYDRESALPFLAEACVVEQDSPAYVAGVLADVCFHQHVLRVRDELRKDMRRYRALLTKAGINERQLQILQSSRFDAADTPADVDTLLRHGYLMRVAVQSEPEKRPFLEKVHRQMAEAARLAGKGASEDAARVRKRAERVLRHTEATRLERTTAGYRVSKSFPAMGVAWDSGVPDDVEASTIGASKEEE